MAGSADIRILYPDQYDGSGFTNENTLAKAMLTKPDKINPIITYLAGRDSKKFPLSFMSEGQNGGTKKIELNDIQYEWDTFFKPKTTDSVASVSFSTAPASTAKPGINYTPIYVEFETEWLKTQHNITSPKGYTCRIQSKPTPTGSGKFQYKLIYIGSSDASAYVDPTEFAAGTLWTMEGGANVSQSYSMGNASNKNMPGKMRNQISILRKSYEWAGNVENKMVEVSLPTQGGGTTNYWMPFERWQHMMDFKQGMEEHLWWAKYNRKADGSIPHIDEDSNLPIPVGAGLVDQMINQDTYGELTTSKLKNTVGDIFYGMTDTDKMDVVLYTGLGGAEEFDTACKNDATNFTQIIGDKFVTGAGRNLKLGGFFAQYEHVDGHVVTVRISRMCDHGSRAQNSELHPRTGRPLSSYDMFFVDQSTYDGVRNVQLVCEKGRSMLSGYLKGLTPTPMDFGGNDMEMLSTEQDKCSVHYLATTGVCLNRNTTSFYLRCNLS
jgi:hypothetical protein